MDRPERLIPPAAGQRPCEFEDIISELQCMVGLWVIVQLDHQDEGTVVDFDGSLVSVERFDIDGDAIVYCNIGERFKVALSEQRFQAGMVGLREVAIAQPGGLVQYVYPMDEPQGPEQGRACGPGESLRRRHGRRRPG